MNKKITIDDIKLEASLLKALTNKDVYTKYISSIDTKRLIPTTALIIRDYKRWYDKFNKDVDLSEFYIHFAEWHEELDENDLAYYRNTVFEFIENSEIENSLYVSLQERDSKAKIEGYLKNGVNEEAIEEELKVLKSIKNKHKGEDDVLFKLGNVDLSVLDTRSGLSWFLPSLQAGVGSHMPGQFYVVSADSDVGKSAFCISQAVHVFKQLNKAKSNRPILYCTSEDTKEDLVCRFLSCLYKDKVPGGFENIIEQYDKVVESYVRYFDDSLFCGMLIRGTSDLNEIRRQIFDINPSYIVIDMLDKLSNSDHIQDLTRLYQDIRGIANDGYQIIGTTQAGNTSYQYKDPDTQQVSYKTRKWLTDKDTAGSKGGGKQGAAYGMIMIGKDDDVPNIRYVTTTKKKRGKHCNITCTIDEKFSSYKELL